MEQLEPSGKSIFFKVMFPVSTDALSICRNSQVPILIAKLNTAGFLFDSNNYMKEFPQDKVICLWKQRPLFACQAQLWSVPTAPSKIAGHFSSVWSEDILRSPQTPGCFHKPTCTLWEPGIPVCQPAKSWELQGTPFQRHPSFHRHFTNGVPPAYLLHQHMVCLSHARLRWEPAQYN